MRRSRRRSEDFLDLLLTPQRRVRRRLDTPSPSRLIIHREHSQRSPTSPTRVNRPVGGGATLPSPASSSYNHEGDSGDERTIYGEDVDMERGQNISPVDYFGKPLTPPPPHEQRSPDYIHEPRVLQAIMSGLLHRRRGVPSQLPTTADDNPMSQGSVSSADDPAQTVDTTTGPFPASSPLRPAQFVDNDVTVTPSLRRAAPPLRTPNSRIMSASSSSAHSHLTRHAAARESILERFARGMAVLRELSTIGAPTFSSTVAPLSPEGGDGSRVSDSDAAIASHADVQISDVTMAASSQEVGNVSRASDSDAKRARTLFGIATPVVHKASPPRATSPELETSPFRVTTAQSPPGPLPTEAVPPKPWSQAVVPPKSSSPGPAPPKPSPGASLDVVKTERSRARSRLTTQEKGKWRAAPKLCLETFEDPRDDQGRIKAGRTPWNTSNLEGLYKDVLESYWAYLRLRPDLRRMYEEFQEMFFGLQVQRPSRIQVTVFNDEDDVGLAGGEPNPEKLSVTWRKLCTKMQEAFHVGIIFKKPPGPSHETEFDFKSHFVIRHPLTIKETILFLSKEEDANILMHHYAAFRVLLDVATPVNAAEEFEWSRPVREADVGSRIKEVIAEESPAGPEVAKVSRLPEEEIGKEKEREMDGVEAEAEDLAPTPNHAGSLFSGSASASTSADERGEEELEGPPPTKKGEGDLAISAVVAITTTKPGQEGVTPGPLAIQPEPPRPQPPKKHELNHPASITPTPEHSPSVISAPLGSGEATSGASSATSNISEAVSPSAPQRPQSMSGVSAPSAVASASAAPPSHKAVPTVPAPSSQPSAGATAEDAMGASKPSSAEVPELESSSAQEEQVAEPMDAPHEHPQAATSPASPRAPSSQPSAGATTEDAMGASKPSSSEVPEPESSSVQLEQVAEPMDAPHEHLQAATSPASPRAPSSQPSAGATAEDVIGASGPSSDEVPEPESSSAQLEQVAEPMDAPHEHPEAATSPASPRAPSSQPSAGPTAEDVIGASGPSSDGVPEPEFAWQEEQVAEPMDDSHEHPRSAEATPTPQKENEGADDRSAVQTAGEDNQEATARGMSTMPAVSPAADSAIGTPPSTPPVRRGSALAEPTALESPRRSARLSGSKAKLVDGLPPTIRSGVADSHGRGKMVAAGDAKAEGKVKGKSAGRGQTAAANGSSRLDQHQEAASEGGQDVEAVAQTVAVAEGFSPPLRRTVLSSEQPTQPPPRLRLVHQHRSNHHARGSTQDDNVAVAGAGGTATGDERRPAPVRSSHWTRSTCHMHSVTVPQLREEATATSQPTRWTFLVPECALSDHEALAREGVHDNGEADPESEKDASQAGDFERVPTEVHACLSRAIGAEILMDCWAILPKMDAAGGDGEEERRDRFSARSWSPRSEIPDTESAAEVDELLSAVSLGPLSSKKKRRRGRLSEDNKSYKPSKGDEDEDTSSEGEGSGTRRLAKRPRVISDQGASAPALTTRRVQKRAADDETRVEGEDAGRTSTSPDRETKRVRLNSGLEEQSQRAPESPTTRAQPTATSQRRTKSIRRKSGGAKASDPSYKPSQDADMDVREEEVAETLNIMRRKTRSQGPAGDERLP